MYMNSVAISDASIQPTYFAIGIPVVVCMKQLSDVISYVTA